MSAFMSVFADLVEGLAELLEPLFQASAAAAAIVLFTAFVRLLVHPLSRAAARGQRERAKLQPQIAELRKKHKKNPEKLQKAVMELHAKEKVSPLSGCLPSLFQLPAFFLLYHLFSNSTIGGEANEMLAHKLFAAPLGGRWADALGEGGVFGAQGLVYLGLFAVVAAVATFNYRRTKRQMATGATGGVAAGGEQQVPGMGAVLKIMPLMSFMTLFTVAVVPLAAALYVVTSTTWSAVERAVLYRDMPGAGGAAMAATAG
ncbi:YidC/Oxa1 family membrane protein insertase [Streptomyces sporangiiformans]|uniref:Membrane protein insertase YidC n=1 Tax=Streptomyces sporangiiformans TaxID=2315329 RepID=A0A505D738_9ACTN|nr:YidC/Oxa1 family membrane protein insertase [Streptomyces sporangiiformans]TPQ18410.1 YidC/Oxa1 family membrane protein insertase [Streptomyces sporangiiformans]